MEEIKECKIHGKTTFKLYKNGNSYTWRCLKCRSQAVLKRRDKVKTMAVIYKGGKCQLCGYDKYVGALEFHHIDPTLKDFSISKDGYTRSWEKVKIELNKCVLLCANCHREVHAGVLECPTIIINDEKSIEDLLPKNEDKLEKLKNNKLYKVPLEQRPSKEELFKMIKNMSFTEIGKKYGVSDNSIRKWCKNYGLPSTKKELRNLK